MRPLKSSFCKSNTSTCLVVVMLHFYGAIFCFVSARLNCNRKSNLNHDLNWMELDRLILSFDWHEFKEFPCLWAYKWWQPEVLCMIQKLLASRKWLWTWEIENWFTTFLLKHYYGFAVVRWRAIHCRVRCHAIPVTGKSVLPNRLLFELTASMILQSISEEISLVFCQLCIAPFRTMEKSTSLTLIWKQNSTDGKCALQRSKKQYSTTKALTKERFTLANTFVWKLETQEVW